MAEQTQIQQVTTKEPKRVEAGNRLAECNHRNREELAQLKAQKSESETKLTYYSTGEIMTIGVLGILGYYVHQSKTPKENLVNQTNEASVHWPREAPDNKFEMD